MAFLKKENKIYLPQILLYFSSKIALGYIVMLETT